MKQSHFILGDDQTRYVTTQRAVYQPHDGANTADIDKDKIIQAKGQGIEFGGQERNFVTTQRMAYQPVQNALTEEEKRV